MAKVAPVVKFVNGIDETFLRRYIWRMMSVGDALLLARRRAKLSQLEIAAAIGVSAPFVSMIERGYKVFPPDRVNLLPARVRESVSAALVAQKEAEIAELRAANGDAA